jgi:hypothetical protein
VINPKFHGLLQRKIHAVPTKYRLQNRGMQRGFGMHVDPFTRVHRDAASIGLSDNGVSFDPASIEYPDPCSRFQA